VMRVANTIESSSDRPSHRAERTMSSVGLFDSNTEGSNSNTEGSNRNRELYRLSVMHFDLDCPKVPQYPNHPKV
jgi:hypothetical protein